MTVLLASGSDPHSALNTILWVAIPYVAITIFVVDHYWRYRYDKFGWTTRSSQLYERRLLRWGSPLFHFGILLVALGHIGGLLIPESWTAAAGVSESAYHAAAAGLGTVAGFCTLVGVAILIYRRRTVGPVFSATTRNDKAMYVLLVGTILLGLGTTVLGNLTGHPHDYRQTVVPWFRSIFYLHPDTGLILKVRSGSAYMSCAPGRCSPSGPSADSYTYSPPRSATSPGPTSSTAAVTPNSVPAPPSRLGERTPR
jgi:nitrate reductase gamma subunit